MAGGSAAMNGTSSWAANPWKRAGATGFTLVELLLVIVIIGILASMMVVGLAGRSQDARVTAAKGDIAGSLAIALDLFEADVGRYPTPEEGLKALITPPADATGWKGPYLQTELKPDPWGQEYVYAIDPQYPDRYVLTSSGPDRQPGTPDDVRR